MQTTDFRISKQRQAELHQWGVLLSWYNFVIIEGATDKSYSHKTLTTTNAVYDVV
jgi:hypothetical protein